MIVSCLSWEGRNSEGYPLFYPPPANLKAPATQKKTDEKLVDTIRNGHPNTTMETWKYALSQKERKEVLTYFRIPGGTTL